MKHALFLAAFLLFSIIGVADADQSCPSSQESHAAIQAYIWADVQGSKILAENILDAIERVKSFEQDRVEINGNAYRLILSKNEVVLESDYAATSTHQLCELENSLMQYLERL